jgi:hypothetical protein
MKNNTNAVILDELVLTAVRAGFYNNSNRCSEEELVNSCARLLCITHYVNRSINNGTYDPFNQEKENVNEH